MGLDSPIQPKSLGQPEQCDLLCSGSYSELEHNRSLCLCKFGLGDSHWMVAPTGIAQDGHGGNRQIVMMLSTVLEDSL